MASRFIGTNFGKDTSPDNLTEGSSTGSVDVEVQINTTNMASAKATRYDVIDILNAIIRRIEDGRETNLTL
jgi:hypothetical protein